MLAWAGWGGVSPGEVVMSIGKQMQTPHLPG
jgi:hypothetical protein